MAEEPTAAERPARQRIMDAAEELFAREGFDRTPVSRIAALAGVPHGLVFYYFRTKIGLLLALIRDYSSTLVPAFDEAADDPTAEPGTPAELARLVLGTFRRHSRGRIGFRRIVFQEMAVHPEVRDQARMLNEQAIRAVAGRLQRGVAAIGLPVDPATVTTAARMLIATEIMETLLGEGSDPLPADDLAAVVAGMLVHGGNGRA